MRRQMVTTMYNKEDNRLLHVNRYVCVYVEKVTEQNYRFSPWKVILGHCTLVV